MITTSGKYAGSSLTKAKLSYSVNNFEDPFFNNVELVGNKSLIQLGLFTELDNIVLDCGTSTVNV